MTSITAPTSPTPSLAGIVLVGSPSVPVAAGDDAAVPGGFPALLATRPPAMVEATDRQPFAVSGKPLPVAGEGTGSVGGEAALDWLAAAMPSAAKARATPMAVTAEAGMASAPAAMMPGAGATRPAPILPAPTVSNARPAPAGTADDLTAPVAADSPFPSSVEQAMRDIAAASGVPSASTVAGSDAADRAGKRALLRQAMQSSSMPASPFVPGAAPAAVATDGPAADDAGADGAAASGDRLVQADMAPPPPAPPPAPPVVVPVVALSAAVAVATPAMEADASGIGTVVPSAVVRTGVPAVAQGADTATPVVAGPSDTRDAAQASAPTTDLSRVAPEPARLRPAEPAAPVLAMVAPAPAARLADDASARVAETGAPLPRQVASRSTAPGTPSSISRAPYGTSDRRVTPVPARAEPTVPTRIAVPVSPPAMTVAASLPAAGTTVPATAHGSMPTAAAASLLAPAQPVSATPGIAASSEGTASVVPSAPSSRQATGLRSPPPRMDGTAATAIAGDVRVDTAARTFAEAIHRAVAADVPATDGAAATAAATPVTASLANAAVPPRMDAPIDLRNAHWPARMIERIEAMRDMADANDMSIRLVPDALGKIDVALTREGDTVQVRMTAEQPQTRQLLAEAAPKLQELAEQRGVRLTQAGAEAPGGQTAGQTAGGQTAGQRQPAPQQQSAQQQHPSAPPRVRRDPESTAADERLA